MAGKLIFSLSAVRGLMAHALSTPDRRQTFGESEDGVTQPPAALWLVKDQGVYLMSNGKCPEGEKPVVVYAEGLNPEKDEFDDWWDAASDICGGDDFVESLALTELPADGPQFNNMVITMTVDSLTLELAA